MQLFTNKKGADRYHQAPTINCLNQDTTKTIRNYYFFFLRLILAPAFLASDKAIAIACLWLFTFGPFLDPLCNSPSLYSCITFSIFVLGIFFFFAIIFLPVTFRHGLKRFSCTMAIIFIAIITTDWLTRCSHRRARYGNR